MASKLVPFNKAAQTPQAAFGNMLEDFFADPWFPFRQPELETFKLDVKEDDKAYTVEAEVPGVKKKDITLDLESGRLTIGIAAKEESDKDDKKVVHKERRYSYMERSIYLADAADSGAEAKLDNGELVVTVPKMHPGAPKQAIEITEKAAKPK